MYEIPFRQIHLDFHTSGLIPDVGQDFDSEDFARMLSEAHVQSINIFARCHHGYGYYPSKVVPVHPSLKFDLLGSMIEALHHRGIQCPVYTTVVWDEYSAERHPEWCQMDSSGRIVGRKPFGTNEGSDRWLYLCVNSSYLEYVEAHVKEVMSLYEPDGMWFDILKEGSDGCSCPNCRRGMQEEGLDPSKVDDRRTYAHIILRRAMDRLSSLVRKMKPESLIFFNGRQRIDTRPGRSLREELKYVSHLEIESLASGEWGYNHFPLFVRYNQTFGKEIIGMTGRFHRSWGDFGGYKNTAALEYECFTMIANCAKVCVGDQLHPRGHLDKATYDLIAPIFASIANKEPWCRGAIPVADIGILAVNDGDYGPSMRPRIKTLEAAMQLLLEDGRQFQIIDAEADFSEYKVLVCPDILRFNETIVDKVHSYLASGGKLLLSYASGLAYGDDRFAIDIGAEMKGFSEYRTSYLRLGPSLAAGDDETDYVVYENAVNVLPNKAEVLASLVHPYFDRSWDHFMSHAQTPPDRPGPYAGILRYGNIIYFAHPIFTVYKHFGNIVYKRSVSKALDLLLGKRLVVTNLPSTAQVTLTEQKNEGRLIVHIIHYPRERRAKIDIIEDVIPLFNIKLDVMYTNAPRRVYLAPEGNALPFLYEMGVVSFTVPEVHGHAMVVIE